MLLVAASAAEIGAVSSADTVAAVIVALVDDAPAVIAVVVVFDVLSVAQSRDQPSVWAALALTSSSPNQRSPQMPYF